MLVFNLTLKSKAKTLASEDASGVGESLISLHFPGDPGLSLCSAGWSLQRREKTAGMMPSGVWTHSGLSVPCV